MNLLWSHFVLIVKNPEGFEDGIGTLGFCQPCIDFGGDVWSVTKYAAGMVANEILRMVEEFDKFISCGTFDLGPVFDDGFASVGDSPYPAVFTVPSWVSHVVLSMANDARAEVGDIHASIQSEGNVHRAEGLVW